MEISSRVAKQFRDVHFGGNWTSVNLRNTLADVNWQEATTKIQSFNSILALVYHMNYYVSAVLQVLEGGSLDASDKFSFDHPVVSSEEDWQALLNKTWTDAEKFALLVENLPDEKLAEDFTDGKYGDYYRNIHGIIEHIHYHLGQVVLLKKMIKQS
jgi:hypothetical protein